MFKNKKYEKIREYLWYVPFGIFLCYLLLQYSKVFLMFDDFGAATMSYITPIDDCYNRTFSQAFVYLWRHYTQWGGRVPCYIFNLIVLQCPRWVTNGIYAGAVFFVYLFEHRIVSQKENYKIKLVLAIFFVLSYGVFTLAFVNRCFYWYSAANLYVLPLVPLLFSLMIVNKYEIEELSKLKKGLLFFLLFLIGFMQEQVSIVVLVSLFLIIIKKRKNIKNIKRADVVGIASAFLGFVLLMASPGSWRRLAKKEKADVSIVKKVYENTSNVIKSFLATGNKLYLSIMLLAIIVFVAFAIKKAKILRYCVLICSISVLVFNLVSVNGVYVDTANHFGNKIAFLLVGAYVFLVLAVSIVGYLEKDDVFHIILFISGMASIPFICVINSSENRVFVPFMMLSFVFISEMIKIMLNDKKTSIVIFILMLILGYFGFRNISEIYEQYNANYEYQLYNDTTLKISSYEIKCGADIQEIRLRKLPSNQAYVMMPYLWDYGLTTWMHYYYDIPQDVEFVWE